MLPKSSTASAEMREIRVEVFVCFDFSRVVLPKLSIVSKCQCFVGRSDDRQQTGEQEKEHIEENLKSMFS